MNRLLFFFLFASLAPASVLAGPYAPRAPEAVASMKVPDASAVPVPAYPGAKASAANAGVKYTANDKTGQGLPTVALATKDGIGKVVAFYKGKLKGWKYMEKYGSHVFWRGADSYNMMDMTQSMTTENVTIVGMAHPSMPGSKTTMTIVYK